LWNAEGGVPYKNKTNNKQKQAGERPETHRFARSKRVYERIVIGVKLASAWWRATSQYIENYCGTPRAAFPTKIKQTINKNKPASDLKLIVLQEVSEFTSES